MKQPIERFRDRMADLGVDAALISDVNNVRWLTGFAGSTANVIVTPSEAVFISDSRYEEQAREEVHGFSIEILRSPKTYPEMVAECARRLEITGLAFEADHVTFAAASRWAKKMNGIVLTPVEKLLDPLRMIKHPSELEKIRAACGIADACFSHAQRLFQPGVAEYDIAMEIEFYIRRQGAKPAFDVIAVSGPRSARPHGDPSERKLQRGDFLTLDFGACVDGYCSDITRTVVIGEASDEQRRVYGAVLEAQLAAIEAMKPGIEAKKVDALARETLAKHDLAQYFGHGLGHGLGLLVHDVGSMNATSEDVLEAGQVWTVEPGVYIEGFGGVRIEDDVLIGESGAEVLTRSPKNLMEFA